MFIVIGVLGALQHPSQHSPFNLTHADAHPYYDFDLAMRFKSGGFADLLLIKHAYQTIEGHRWSEARSSTVRLHPRLAELYAEKVQQLEEALNDPEIRDEAPLRRSAPACQGCGTAARTNGSETLIGKHAQS